MASPIQFYRNFQRLMRDHGIRHVLTSGMACVELVERGIWECVNRERYLVYQHEWKDFYRRWQKDQVGQWPTAESFELQHRRITDAALRFDLTAAPLSDASRREEVYLKGLNRALALTAATSAEASAVTMPIQVILP